MTTLIHVILCGFLALAFIGCDQKEKKSSSEDKAIEDVKDPEDTGTDAGTDGDVEGNAGDDDDDDDIPPQTLIVTDYFDSDVTNITMGQALETSHLTYGSVDETPTGTLLVEGTALAAPTCTGTNAVGPGNKTADPAHALFCATQTVDWLTPYGSLTMIKGIICDLDKQKKLTYDGSSTTGSTELSTACFDQGFIDSNKSLFPITWSTIDSTDSPAFGTWEDEATLTGTFKGGESVGIIVNTFTDTKKLSFVYQLSATLSGSNEVLSVAAGTLEKEGRFSYESRITQNGYSRHARFSLGGELKSDNGLKFKDIDKMSGLNSSADEPATVSAATPTLGTIFTVVGEKETGFFVHRHVMLDEAAANWTGGNATWDTGTTAKSGCVPASKSCTGVTDFSFNFNGVPGVAFTMPGSLAGNYTDPDDWRSASLQGPLILSTVDVDD